MSARRDADDRAGLRSALERALAPGGEAVDRLGSAGTSVTFRVADAPEESVTLLLDRHPPALADAGEPAEIAIELDASQASAFAAGELAIPARVLSGEIAYRGPVRKYLTLDPILRALLARASGAAG